MRRIIALSGPIASGKSTLASRLVDWSGDFHICKTQEFIKNRLGTDLERKALQLAGERLDKSTGGSWVADMLAKTVVQDLAEDVSVIVDSVRIKGQVDALRRAFGGHVVHIHLTAPTDELSRRYTKRTSSMQELPSYRAVQDNQTEAEVDTLKQIADIVVDTHRCTKSDVFVRTISQLGLYGKGYVPLVDVLVGGQWGSEGKGHLSSYLAPEYDVLVRVGGPNAGHTVHQRSGAVTYYQLPSGTRHSEAKLIIGPGAVLNVDKLLLEIKSARIDTDRVCIDPQAMIIESADVLGEEDLLSGIGSTRQGVGFASSRKVLRNASDPPVRLAKDVQELYPFIVETREILDLAFSKGWKVFLEGTQGTGLSLHHGSYPFVTSRDTTVSGCLAEAGIAPSRVRRTIMVMRSYPIRVGGKEYSGPMGRALSFAEISRRSGQSVSKLRKTERTSTTNRPRRIAEFSWAQLRQSSSINGPTDIALSFADYISKRNERARRFEQLTSDTIYFIEEIERVACAPVSLIVTRFSHGNRSIIDRRIWR